MALSIHCRNIQYFTALLFTKLKQDLLGDFARRSFTLGNKLEEAVHQSTMSGEFNIFNNLEEMMKCNILQQIRSLDAANNSNSSTEDIQCNNDDFDEFESLLSNQSKSPPKRSSNKESLAEVSEKKPKKDGSRHSNSSSKEGSLSPPNPLFENFASKLANVSVSGRTRRSMGKTKEISNITSNGNAALDGVQIPVSSRRGRGGRGKGRGRGRADKSSTADSNSSQTDNRSLTDESPNQSSGADYQSESSNQMFAADYQPQSTMDRFIQRSGNTITTRSQVKRNRRNLVAELAARCQTVDHIDLVNSPFPRVEGTITLDSDDEMETTHTCNQKDNKATAKTADPAVTNNSLDISLEEDNPELSVKIKWKGTPEAFKLRKYQKFLTIFKILAEREQTNMESIVFNLGDRIISPDDTPDAIGYKIYQFINGRVLTTSHINSPLGTNGVIKKRRNAGQISLKIQSDKWKRPLSIDIQKTDKFRILYIKCSEELNVGIGQIKLSFDGEQLELNDTPADLELEGGEAIDLRLKN